MLNGIEITVDSPHRVLIAARSLSSSRPRVGNYIIPHSLITVGKCRLCLSVNDLLFSCNERIVTLELSKYGKMSEKMSDINTKHIIGVEIII